MINRYHRLTQFITSAAGEFEIKIQDSKNSDGLQYYTLICLDPDAPSRANPVAGPYVAISIVYSRKKLMKSKSWLHSIQTSLLSTGLPQHDVNDLALVPYTGPSPPEKTSLHRYTFLLYRQPAADLHPLSKHASPKSVSRFDRRNFDCEGFVKSNGLELVAINWFFCENQGLAKA